MIFRAPMYYKDFHCIADKCKDSCCSAGWEIDIDKQTETLYRNVPGEYGDKLRASITNTSPCQFKLDKNNNCPFLNKNKLCDIYINLGEDSLCQICKDHPRYYEWFDFAGVKEAGVGLCCEEAARIILSETRPFSVDESIIDDSDLLYSYLENDYDITLYNYLIKAREKMINYIDNHDDTSISAKLKNVLWYSFTLQQNIDNDMLDEADIFEISSNIQADITPIIEYMATLEPNDKKWPDYLKKCAQLSAKYVKKIDEFEAENPQIDNNLKNISIYFIWRYLLKGVFDGDILSEIKLMYVSCQVIKYLLFCKWLENGSISLEDCINLVKKYSEEVEYCEENLDKFVNDSYDEDFFETNYLLGI